jgi:hypothetical protein
VAQRRGAPRRLIVIAIVGVGLVLSALGVYAGLFAPPAHSGRRAIAVVADSAPGGRQQVSVAGPDGPRVVVALRDAAREYEVGGPVPVFVDDDDPARVYDANGGRSATWLVLVATGLLLVVFARQLAAWVGRNGRSPVSDE